MKIDKASFLLLAGALAAGACVVTTGGEDDDGSGGAGTGATGGDATTNGGSGGSEGGAGGGGVGGTGGGGGTCDDSVGTSADCTTAVTTCVEGVVVGLDDITLCEVAADYFKPGVAEEATNCIVNLASTATCDDVLGCRDQALQNACEDDVSIECDALYQDCGGAAGPIDLAECNAILPGFSEAGRTALVEQCGPAAEGCLQGGVYQTLLECVDNMLPAP